MTTRRLLLTAGLALPWAMSVATPTRAGRLVTLIVGAPAGRGTDLAARAFAPFLERHLRHTRIAVLNEPGEAGVAALRLLAAADAPDSVLAFVSSPALPARMVDHPDGAAVFARLRLVGAVRKEPIVLVAPPDTPIGSVAELLRLVGPGTNAAVLGTPAEGSPGHLAALRLQALAGTPLNIVAFPSAAAARQATQARNVAAAALAMGEAIEGLRAGTLTGIGIAAHRRSRAFPTIAPLGESGVALSAPILRGIAAPAALSDAALAPLAAALRGIVSDPEFTAAGDEAGFLPDFLDGAGWQAAIQRDHRQLAALWQARPWQSSLAG